MDQTDNSAGAASLMEKVRTGAAAQLGTQKDRATDGLGRVVEAARRTTEHLRENQHETVAQYVENAAGQLERFSNRLKDRDVGDLFQDAQQFARRRPAVFIGSAFALGVVAARFLKSSNGGNGQDVGASVGQFKSTGYPSAPDTRGHGRPAVSSRVEL
jgi:hypothetical protein